MYIHCVPCCVWSPSFTSTCYMLPCLVTPVEIPYLMIFSIPNSGRYTQSYSNIDITCMHESQRYDDQTGQRFLTHTSQLDIHVFWTPDSLGCVKSSLVVNQCFSCQ